MPPHSFAACVLFLVLLQLSQSLSSSLSDAGDTTPEIELRIIHAAASLAQFQFAINFFGTDFVSQFGVETEYSQFPQRWATHADVQVTLHEDPAVTLLNSRVEYLKPSVTRITLVLVDYDVIGPVHGVRAILLVDDANPEDVVDGGLDVNNAAVRFINCATGNTNNETVYIRSLWCEGCAETAIANLTAYDWSLTQHTIHVDNDRNFFVDVGIVAWPLQVYLGTPQLQTIELQFGYLGAYTVLFLAAPGHTQPVTTFSSVMQLTDTSPELWWLPLLGASCGLIGLIAIAAGTSAFYRRRQRQSTYEVLSDGNAPLESASLLGEETTPVSVQAQAKSSPRMQSLDTFRGACLAIMIFVNYGGGSYWFFDHSYWNGLTVADLVFPWFTFIMGVSMTFALSSMQRREVTSTIVKRILRRTLLLFLLGLFLNNGNDTAHWRIPGVLQYFAFTYGVCALIVVLVPQTPSNGDKFADLAPFSLQWLAALIFPLISLIVTFGLDVPGCGKGYLGPGGIAENGAYGASCVGGASTYVDNWFFSPNHVYTGPTCVEFYQCGPHDPEGLLGAFNAVLLCWLGVSTGRTLLYYKSPRHRLMRMLIWAVVLGAIGCGLCGGRRDGGVIPVNKNLWSLSFVLVLACGANLMLGLCYIVVDIKRWWLGMPFRAMGMNSIVIYCGHELLGGFFPFHFVTPHTHGWLLFQNIVGVSCWLIIGYLLYRNNTFFNL